ncbi:hypothetical protein AK830_g3543 [Neonectria ditissima]|uniref:Uncharacterized protein n=1 Tax=Neonectria ditissima TaxID=78410 RepID=A0A0N8H7X9_9HYPO|nr:hypothetical protein AK830_g3543 [Neonectria ditissima]
MTPKDAATSSGGVSDPRPEQQSIQNLQIKHREIFTRAVSNVLSSPIAEVTFAQIVDGLPLSDVALDTYAGTVCPGHPLLDERVELSPGVLEKARQLRSTFDATTLRFDSKLLRAYQAAAPGSRSFQTNLIELVARAIHYIGIWLFKQGSYMTPSNDLVSWKPSDEDEAFYPHGYPPTLFWHPWYHDYDQYPEGVADGVGYWAEARIFGGVVLFDRRHVSDASTESHDVYLHSDRRDVTYRIFKLLDEQKHSLVQFLLSDVTPPPSCPLPLLGDVHNRERVDPEEPITSTGIYRDEWERKPPSEDDWDRRRRDVVDTFNYISQDDWAAAKTRAIMKRFRPL